MPHRGAAGGEAALGVKFTRMDPAVSVQQTWSGGDGGMAGTVIVTIVPFDDIGRIHFHGPIGIGDDTLTVVVESAHGSFPETLNSPLRHRAMRVLPPVHATTPAKSGHLTFR